MKEELSLIKLYNLHVQDGGLGWSHEDDSRKAEE